MKPVTVNFKNLNNAVEMKVVKKSVYDELVKRVNAINTSVLVKKTDFDAKINEIECKTPSITGLATTDALNGIGNNIPNVSDQVKKTDCDAKISDI